MRVILYEPKIRRTVISLLDTDNIHQLIKEWYGEDADEIPLGRKHLYRVAIASNYLYRRQPPCCWKSTEDGKELIVGNVLFIRKERRKYKSLTDKDMVYIMQNFHPYDYNVI